MDKRVIPQNIIRTLFNWPHQYKFITFLSTFFKAISLQKFNQSFMLCKDRNIYFVYLFIYCCLHYFLNEKLSKFGIMGIYFKGANFQTIGGRHCWLYISQSFLLHFQI